MDDDWRELDSAVEQLLRERLARMARPDVEPALARLRALLAAASIGRDDRIELARGGWIAKPTRLEGLTDVDAVVVLEDAAAAAVNPRGMPAALAARLGPGLAHWAGAVVDVTGLLVSAGFPDGIELRLLPALRRDGEVRMAAEGGEAWFGISPVFFATQLAAADARAGGCLVPTIRLAKLVIADLPAAGPLAGYHVETLAIAVFRGYTGAVTLPAMLEHYFAGASGAVLRPLVSSTGQSLHIDDALGPAGSQARRRVEAALGTVGRRMREADGVAAWAAMVPVPG